MAWTSDLSVAESHSMDGWAADVYPFLGWWAFESCPHFGYPESGCNERSRTSVCVATCFHFPRVDAWERNCCNLRPLYSVPLARDGLAPGQAQLPHPGILEGASLTPWLSGSSVPPHLQPLHFSPGNMIAWVIGLVPGVGGVWGGQVSNLKGGTLLGFTIVHLPDWPSGFAARRGEGFNQVGLPGGGGAGAGSLGWLAPLLG